MRHDGSIVMECWCGQDIGTYDPYGLRWHWLLSDGDIECCRPPSSTR